MNKELIALMKEKRRDFPILNQKIHGHNLIYADNAATSQTPKQVIDSLVDYYTTYNSNVHRGIHSLSEKATTEYEKARDKVAKFIGVSHKEVIFTSGTTDGINMLTHMLKPLLTKGDEVVLTEMEHHANLVPWQELARELELVLKFIPYTKDYELDVEKAKEIISKKTKIIAMSHSSNVLGGLNPVKEISDFAKQFRSLIVLDAAQTAAYMKLDVKELGCDFMVFSGHKMCGPTGIGVLYGEKEYLNNLLPSKYGGNMIEHVQLKQSTFAKGAQKFETGTPNIADAIALGYAIDYLEEAGLNNIQEYMKELTQYTAKKLEEVEHLTIYGPKDNRSAVFSFTLKNVHALDMSHLLDSKGIAIRTGQHCAIPLVESLGQSALSRISLYFYNTFEEVDIIVEELKKISKKFN